MKIIEARSAAELAAAEVLMRKFLAWVHIRYREWPEIVAAYYDMAQWERALSGLAVEYPAPDGCVLLALIDDEPAGCVAMKRVDPATCEMKRLFIRDRYQGAGAGRTLCTALLDAARTRNYAFMRLETGDQQSEAQALYRSLGFYEIEPYHPHQELLLAHVVSMEITL